MDPVLRLRNDLFREFYHFFCEFYASRFNKRARGIIEACTLIAVSNTLVCQYFCMLIH